MQELLNEHNITSNITTPDYRDKWDLNHNVPSSDLKNIIGPKNESTSDKMKETSLEYIQKKYNHKLQIYTDGSRDPDKQTSGAAFVIHEYNIQAAYKTNPILSIFINELIAIERAIEWSIHNNIPETVILTDSLSSVQSLQAGKYHTRPDKINHILARLDAAKTQGILIHIDWIPAHVGIPGNEIADTTARSAMTTGSPDHTIPSKSETYPLINEAIMKKWQQQWNNTLTGHIYQSIQPKVIANKTSHFVASWYRPPGNTSEVFQLFREQLDYIRTHHKGKKLPSVHVLGDFNFKDIDWPDRLSKSGSTLSQSEGQILIDIMNDHGLEQMVHFPTLEKNTLDLILTTLPGQFKDVRSPDKLSDHDIVSGTLKNFYPPPPPIKKPRRKVYLYQKGDYESMRKDTLEFAKEKILQWSLGYSFSSGEL